jgi:hypothetical protein
MNDRLAIAAQLLAGSPWVTCHPKQAHELVRKAVEFSDALIRNEEGTRPRPPEPKRWFPGVRRFFRFLLERVYR